MSMPEGARQSPAYPSAQLMQLGQAETVGIHDDHPGRVGYIHTDLYNGSRH